MVDGEVSGVSRRGFVANKSEIHKVAFKLCDVGTVADSYTQQTLPTNYTE